MICGLCPAVSYSRPAHGPIDGSIYVVTGSRSGLATVGDVEIGPGGQAYVFCAMFIFCGGVLIYFAFQLLKKCFATASGEKPGRKGEEAMSELSQKLRVGMKMSEVKKMLGSPSSQLGGDSLFGMFGKVSGSAHAISSVSQRRYVIWRKPEGEYKLVFIGNKLTDIHSTP